MRHPLVDQLYFTRREWLRALRGLSEKDATAHHGQMNCISWNVGHLAWQEQRYFLIRPQGLMPRPDVQTTFTTGAPMSTPALHETLAAWREITKATGPFVEKITSKALLRDLPLDGKHSGQTLGDALRRLTYHYWYHIGENLAIRQMLGHKRLPQYVGAIERDAPYRTERST